MKNQIRVILNTYTPLTVCSRSIRVCWDSNDKSDSNGDNIGPKDKALIYRVGIKHRHQSTLEHLVMNFSISGMPRNVLQEFSRHRIGVSPSIQSSRYTMSKILSGINTDDDIWNYFWKTDDDFLNNLLVQQVNCLLIGINGKYGNDKLKHIVPEGMLCDGVYTINMRAFLHLVMLRQGKGVFQPFRDLVELLIESMPYDYKYLLGEDYE